jgi:hypothetical protein
MTLLVLVLLGVMVLVVTVSPPDRGTGNASRTPVTAAPRAAALTLTDPNAFDVSETLSVAVAGAPRTIEAEVGDRVEITVEGADADSVSLGDLGIDDLEPSSPARFELLADTPGTYPLVLGNDGRRIGTLEIR